MMLEIELRAHHPRGAHRPRHDLGVGPGTEGIGDDIAAVGERGQRREERLGQSILDQVGSDKMQRRIENMHRDVAVAEEQIGVRHGDVAVRQRRDRRPGLVAVREQAEMDLATMRRLAADFVAGGS